MAVHPEVLEAVKRAELIEDIRKSLSDKKLNTLSIEQLELVKRYIDNLETFIDKSKMF